MMIITIIATIGDRSIIPIEGSTRRIGARIGSVIPYSKITMGLSGERLVYEMITRPSIAAQSKVNNMFMK